MVNPARLCARHLLGEHGELHKHLHNWRKHHRVDGRVAVNSIEPMAYKDRHDELEAEMKRRGMKPASPLEQPDFSYLPPEHRNAKVDVKMAYVMLLQRCEQCRDRVGAG